MKTRIIQWDKQKNIFTVDQMPPNVSCNDVIFASPSGEIRNHFDLKWYQKTWLAIDKKFRKWLKIEL